MSKFIAKFGSGSLVGAALFALVSSASANQNLVPGAEIVITGRSIPEPKAVETFVRSVAAPVEGQLSVYRLPVCPEVLGMSELDTQKVLNRVRAVARVAGVRVENAPCSANFTIIVAQNGRQFMVDVAKTRWQSLETLSAGQKAALLGHSGPAWAWRTFAKKTAEGNINAVNDPSLIMGGGSQGGSMTGMATREGSIMREQVRRFTGDSYVVIDEAAIAGKSAVQIADYAVMRGIAGAAGSNAVTGTSILSLFDPDGSDAPESLTYLDLAFLTTVYELPMDRPVIQQISIITDRINRAKTAREAAKKLPGDLDAQN